MALLSALAHADCATQVATYASLFSGSGVWESQIAERLDVTIDTYDLVPLKQALPGIRHQERCLLIPRQPTDPRYDRVYVFNPWIDSHKPQCINGDLAPPEIPYQHPRQDLVAVAAARIQKDLEGPTRGALREFGNSQLLNQRLSILLGAIETARGWLNESGEVYFYSELMHTVLFSQGHPTPENHIFPSPAYLSATREMLEKAFPGIQIEESEELKEHFGVEKAPLSNPTPRTELKFWRIRFKGVAEGAK